METVGYHFKILRLTMYGFKTKYKKNFNEGVTFTLFNSKKNSD